MQLRLRHDVEEPALGEEPGAERLLVAARLVGHDHGADAMGDELEHGVVAGLAHRERGPGEMRAEIRAVRLHDHGGRPASAGAGPASSSPARAGWEVWPGHEAPGSAARGGRQRPRRQRRAEERPGHLPAAARDHDLAVRRPAGARHRGPEVARVDQAVTQPVGERVASAREESRRGSRGRERGPSTARATETAASSNHA